MKDLFYKTVKINSTDHDVLFWGCMHYGDPQWDQHTKYNKEELEGIVKKVLEIAPD